MPSVTEGPGGLRPPGPSREALISAPAPCRLPFTYVMALHAHENQAGAVKSAARVLDIFETLRGEPAGLALSELAARLGLANSSAHGLVQTLLARDYLRRDPETRRYTLGLKLLQLGLAASDDVDLRAAARAIIERLVERTGETAMLAQLDGAELVFIDKVVSQQRPFRTDPRLSARVPLHCSSLGKAMLAALPAAEVRRVVGSPPLPGSTANSITTLSALRVDLQRTRERGFALDHQESMRGVCCAGAPVRDRNGGVVAAVSVSTIVEYFDADRLGPAVADAALEISHALGWQGAGADLWRQAEAVE